ncbi:Hint domain-containing protein [Maritimibacter sp. HL-12]|uniref:Hint domain-containing protein n=1 Tax=Maritimibacter sp. HL-12 TaxID=1162418 RepID=UPI000A0F0D59|nr:Hint domain-containing protein [Maritimibacter sp. HL-12]SMH56013.1 Hint domain-containing protein [Maritimibacter sp. HL-12]
MSFHPIEADLPIRQLSVFRAEAFCVVHGVNEGDALADAADLLHEDVYAFDEAARPLRLGLCTDTAQEFRIAADSATGQPGAPVHLDSLLTFMGPAGETREALVFVEVDPASGTIAQVYVLPLAPFAPRTGYTLVTIEREGARARLAATATVAFTRGTHITMADGQQVPIESIRPGDKVLTRDSGPQPVRWTGVQTLRATGAFAPITIAPGTLNNTGRLVVSPNHRLFIYQRVDALGAGRKEILVKAGLLVNGSSVTQDPGGFVDYFQILFDKHEIIYAEGIAAESLFVDTTTRPALPVEVAQRLADAPGTHRLPGHELGEADLACRENPVDVLKRISAL